MLLCYAQPLAPLSCSPLVLTLPRSNVTPRWSRANTSNNGCNHSIELKSRERIERYGPGLRISQHSSLQDAACHSPANHCSENAREHMAKHGEDVSRWDQARSVTANATHTGAYRV